MTTTPPSISELLSTARSAAIAGDTDAAAASYHQVLALDPDNIDAWMGLAAVLDSTEEKRQALHRVLAIEPNHPEATAALQRLDATNPPPGPDFTLYCANHPHRETLLRCNKCNKPICTECAVQTPVGYRCKECVRAQQDKFYTATTVNQVRGSMGAVISGFLLGIAALLLGRFMGFGFFGILIAIFVGPALGGSLAELIWQISGRKRARMFNLIATAITVIIATPIAVFLSGNFLLPLIVIALAASTIYARLR